MQAGAGRLPIGQSLARLSAGPIEILGLQERVYVLEKVERPIGFDENGDSVVRRRDGRREQYLRVRMVAPDPARQVEAGLIPPTFTSSRTSEIRRSA